MTTPARPKEPIIASAGGVPYNKPWLDYWRQRALTAEAALASIPDQGADAHVNVGLDGSVRWSDGDPVVILAPSQSAAVGKDKRCVKWMSRGVGSDLSGFVNSKAEGEFAVEILGGMAWLDYRPSEPNWIQVKVDAPVPVLDALARLVRANDNLLTPAIVAQALEARP